MGSCCCKEEEPHVSNVPVVPQLTIVVEDNPPAIPISPKPKKVTFFDLEPITKIALKLPHGTNGVYYDKEFLPCDINEWLANLYKDSTWKKWIIYNDDMHHLGKPHTGEKTHSDGKTHSTGGHCKGILAWNDTYLSWLVHSAPNFPREFTGNTISPLEHAEHMYGQSFFYIMRPATAEFVQKAIQQLHCMNAHYLEATHSHTKTETLIFSPTITHIAKSPQDMTDLYSHYLPMYDTDWYVETWKRGSPIKSPWLQVKDITDLCINNIHYKETQDHSKWAVSNQYYFIGDLNRMASQAKRGGGGFLVKDPEIARAFRALIVQSIPSPVADHTILSNIQQT